MIAQRFFDEALSSIVKQTLVPNEIVLAVDGPITEGLENVISKFCKLRKDTTKVLRLDKSLGLAASRHLAILTASNPIIAVMDSDDVCSPDRFKHQIEELNKPNIDVVGGYIEEFNRQIGDLGRVRDVPLTTSKIRRLSRWRNPINHVTLAFKKDRYLAIGGYRAIRHSEDWDLIVRMLCSDFIVVNVPETFVHVRAGDAMFNRRRRWKQVIGDLKLITYFYTLNHLNLFQLFIGVFGRLTLRILPGSLTQMCYRLFRTQIKS
ncbi:glycosyltransferase [Alphaproteobacteria bacterium]|nr:glycosyltransferase [Alphaproteobacteria bacterium]